MRCAKSSVSAGRLATSGLGLDSGCPAPSIFERVFSSWDSVTVLSLGSFTFKFPQPPMDTDCPPPKRVRLDSSPSPARTSQRPGHGAASKIPEEDNCSICLHSVVDRTIIPTCSHEFCFECLLVWSEQSRRCPLCSQPLGDHVIHHIRSKHDYQKHYLPPLRTSPRPVQPRNRNIARREWGRRERQEREEADRLDRAISRRRWIYQHHLYAKHVASNSITRFRPCPTPAQFAASPDLISRMTSFLRRELRVWVNMDVEFLTTFILSLIKSIDIRSESAIKLLAEFLDMDTEYVEGQRHPNAEHFAHEVYSYLRSPYKDLFVYDTVAQYDIPDEIPAPAPPAADQERRQFWRSRSRSRSRSPLPRHTPKRRPSRSRSRSLSWSPSGRQFARRRERGFVHVHDDENREDDLKSDRDRVKGNGNKEEKHVGRKDVVRPEQQRRNVSRDRGGSRKTGHRDDDDDRKERPDRSRLKTTNGNEALPTLSSNNDVKGKQRAKGSSTTGGGDVVCLLPSKQGATTRREEQAPTANAVNAKHVPVSPPASHVNPARADHQPERREHRTLRNNTLQESIRAHLAPHTQRMSLLPKAERKQEQQQQPDDDDANSLIVTSTTHAATADTPSLLERLSSDRTLVQSERQEEHPSSLLRSASSDNDVSPAAAVGGDQTTTCKTQTEDTAAHIMARTRARLATLKNAVAIEANGIADNDDDDDDDDDDAAAAAATGDTSAESDDIRDDDDHVRRARLLSRLELEKKKHLSDASESPACLDGTAAAAPTASPSVPGSSPPPSLLTKIPSPTTTTTDVREITQAAEADLRRRAQLRARLAAAKRNL